ncbi:DUF1697 domain-containing protein [Sinimarinibacterium sp. CAU 1509]|uniref:DUF1697 domain-containing protein n=1 Tax=Sinimarinibacterium sp. CAU 1509 TaxID=2562283 RepID=UPI0010ABAB58|nr:DUF1697 domain-containing protein [Sinimarinibacterium sp. CAU 1509]TJY58893.1 DUF1697 domain-containing protein [Sinimarinibacterium sp. CAU 1509]
MKTFVALLRGINVGGRNMLPMSELSEILHDLGCRDVKTYIQSGNAVFRCDKASGRIAADIAAAIGKRRGFEPHVLVLDKSRFADAIKLNPFGPQAPDAKALHLGFLDAVPATPDLKGLEALKASTEQFSLVGQVFYLLAPEGVGRSKLAARSEKLLGCPMTDRNWKTVTTLMSMLEALPE